MPGQFADYYALLRVGRNAGDLEIKVAYHRCVAILAKASMSAEDREKARELYDRALFVLGDAGRRRAYDVDLEIGIARGAYLAVLAKAGVLPGKSGAAAGDASSRAAAPTETLLGEFERMHDVSALAEGERGCGTSLARLFQRETFVVGAVFALLLATAWTLEIAIKAGRSWSDATPLLKQFFAVAGGADKLGLWAMLFCGSFVWWCLSLATASFVLRVVDWPDIVLILVLYGICIFIPAIYGNLDLSPPTSLLLYFFIPLFLAVFIFDDEAVEMAVWQICTLLGHIAGCHLLAWALLGGMEAYDYIGNEFFTFGYISWWFLLMSAQRTHERLIERRAYRS